MHQNIAFTRGYAGIWRASSICADIKMNDGITKIQRHGGLSDRADELEGEQKGSHPS